MQYRSISAEDIERIYEVAVTSYFHAYSGYIDNDFIQKYVDKNYATDKMKSVVELVKSGKHFFHVAVDEDIIGFCHIGDQGQGMELIRLYVHPDHIGKGIGKKLLQLAEQFVLTKELKSYFCLVHEKNKKGMDFYTMNGFRHIKEKDQRDEENMMLFYFEKIGDQNET
jgi:GNAT superfamily N-acetyltransferase